MYMLPGFLSSMWGWRKFWITASSLSRQQIVLGVEVWRAWRAFVKLLTTVQETVSKVARAGGSNELTVRLLKLQFPWRTSGSLSIYKLKQLSWSWSWRLCNFNIWQLFWRRLRGFIMAENRLVLYVVSKYFFGGFSWSPFWHWFWFWGCLFDRGQIILAFQNASATPSGPRICILKCLSLFGRRPG